MIKLTTRGAVATIQMSRPPVNAIDAPFMAAFAAVLDEIERERPTVVLLRSDQKCFSAGADLAMIQGFFGKPGGTAEMVEYVKTMHAWYNRVERLEAVTIAVIEGPALGGGLELALACDLRLVSHSARLGLPEARVGMIPGAGGTQRLPRLAGPGVAARLILGAELIDGREAERLGIAQWSVEPAAVDARIDEISTRIAGLSRPALLASKHCLAAALDPAIDGYAREIEKPLVLMETPEARERIASFFAGKRG